MRDVQEHLHAAWALQGFPPLVGVEVEGELDLATVPPLRAAVEQRLDGGAGTLFCDLSGVDFADSQLVHWLLWLDGERRRAGGALVVCAPDGPVRRLLDVLGLDRQLTLA